MKGVIVNCLKEMMTNKFGKEKWEAALEKAGLSRSSSFLSTQDVDDDAVLKVVGAACQVLNVTLPQAADAFGEYWVCTFAPKIYRTYFAGVRSAKEFLLKMDEIHRVTTESMPNAHPPRFDYSWENERTLIMKYKSGRGLMDFAIGLIKGVGKYYHEDLQVSRQGQDSVRIVFA
jgi:hypothetical protein